MCESTYIIIIMIIMFIYKAHPFCHETPKALYIEAERWTYMMNKKFGSKTLSDKSKRLKLTLKNIQH